MSGYSTVFLKSKNAAAGTMAFYFRKPEGFSYMAGQSCDLTLLNPAVDDGKGNTHAYSIASAPHEKELMIATRLRDSAFKRSLQSMPAGSAVKLDGPFGTFTLPESSARPVIFLAGGIGITPFRSMMLDAAHRKLSHTIYLFYSNRRQEDAAFLTELGKLDYPLHHLVATVTGTGAQAPVNQWKGEKGRITSEMIRKHAGSMEEYIYYIAGPADMVLALRQMLKEASVNSEDIFVEVFSGYERGA